MKYKILKVLDVTGFTFLTPVVRLCYGEEPREQLKKIGQFIVVPVLAFLVFLGAWHYLAPKHKTKSGEVPTPQVVYDAASDIWTFHERENTKAHAYTLDSEDRPEKLRKVEAYLSLLENGQVKAAELVDAAEEEHSSYLSQAAAHRSTVDTTPRRQS